MTPFRHTHASSEVRTLPPLAAHAPRFDPAAGLLFVVNAASGAHDVEVKRGVIEAASLATDYRRKTSKGKILDICRKATVEWRRLRAAERPHRTTQFSEP